MIGASRHACALGVPSSASRPLRQENPHLATERMLLSTARGWRASRRLFITQSPILQRGTLLFHWWMRPPLQAGIKCVVLKGSMTMAMRDAMISSFTSDSSVTVFLMSLKAGGAPATSQ